MAAPVRAVLMAAASLAWLGGCRPATVVEEQAARPGAIPAVGETYRIDPAASEIHVLVYRAGPLARLGHNHVVAVRELEGRVLLAEGVVGSRFELLVDVDKLEVDSAPLRARYGEAFASEPSEEDIADTRENMLGPALLDAQAYPNIRVVGELASADANAAVNLEIAVKNTVFEDRVPIALDIESDTVTARGMLELSHADLGLMPFSVMLGALRVEEGMEIRFSLTARRAPETS